MDGWTVECNSKQTRKEIIAPESTHVLKGLHSIFLESLDAMLDCAVSLLLWAGQLQYFAAERNDPERWKLAHHSWCPGEQECSEVKLFGGAPKHGWELLCCRGPLVPLYGDAFMRFGQGNLRSVCDVSLQVQGAQPASLMAVKFLGGCGFATHR